MGSAPQVFDISSDEETLVEDVNCSPEDYLWLKEILETVNKETDDSDEVLVLGEYNPKPRSKFQTLGAVNIGYDDDCIVLDGDPDKAPRAGEDFNWCDGDSDEVIVVGQKGQIACRDYPHARYLCAKFPFSSTPHESYCDQCHCFVCDSPAPCAHWVKEASSISHCHATDKEELWKAERKNCKLKKDLVQPVPALHDTPLPASLPQVECVQPLDIIRLAQNSIPQDDVSRQTSLRPCSSIGKFRVPNIIRHGRSQQPGNVWSRNGCQPLPATKRVLGVCNSAIHRDRGSTVGSLGTHAASSNVMFKRAGNVGGPMTNRPSVRGPSINIKSGQASLHRRTPQLATSNEKIPSGWQNCHPNMNLGSSAGYISTEPNMGNVSVDRVLSYPQVYCQTTSQPTEVQVLGIQSQNPTNTVNPDLGFEWVNSTSESNLQPPVGNFQHYNAELTNGAPHFDQFDLCLTGSAELNYDYQCYGSLFSENQSAPVAPTSYVPSEIDVFSPEHTGVDAGMPIFDFETSWNELTRV